MCKFHNIASDRLNRFLAGCSSEAKQAKCLTVLVQDYTVDPNCVKASAVRARGMEMSWKNTSEMFPAERTQLRTAFRLPSVSIQLSEFTVSLQTSSQVPQPWFFLLKAAPFNSSQGVDVWRPFTNCSLDSGWKSWTQFPYPISIYASSRGRLLSSLLSAFVGTPKLHWLLNALAFQQLPLLCLDWLVGCSIIRQAMVVAHQTSGCPASLKHKGDYSAICHEVLFLLLLVLPSSTAASPYTYGQIFLDTSRLLACCCTRCTATFYHARAICKYPNRAAENCCFHVSTVPVYALHFLTKSATHLQSKGVCTTVHNTPIWCQQLHISCIATF